MANSPHNQTRRQWIGWREWAALPDLGVDTIDAKIDTGANSSAIGAFAIRRLSSSGSPMVEFCVQPDGKGRQTKVLCRAPYAGTRIIRSSNGQEEKRIVIDTRICIGDKLWKTELTLTNRDAMDFQLLLGRSALGRKFLVNPAATYLLGQ